MHFFNGIAANEAADSEPGSIIELQSEKGVLARRSGGHRVAEFCLLFGLPVSADMAKFMEDLHELQRQEIREEMKTYGLTQ